MTQIERRHVMKLIVPSLVAVVMVCGKFCPQTGHILVLVAVIVMVPNVSDAKL
jgi:hypothetical protein